MRILSAAVLLASTSCISSALAAEASVTITSPANGAKLDRMALNKIDYVIVPGPQGDHVHLYMDGKESAVLRQLKGSYPLDMPAAGNHEICIKVVNKGHTPIGVQQCIKVTVE